MRNLRQNRSGQVLILAALAVALMIASTIVYVYQTSRVLNEEHPFSPEEFVRIVKLGSRNLVIGSLANISYGGANQTLETNLDRWGSFVEAQYYFGECSLGFELCEDAPYSSGLRIIWGDNGSGITSAKVDFSLNLTSEGADVDVVYPVNVTTSLSISAVSQWQQGYHEINVTIHLYNEGEPALAKNLTVYYQNLFGAWVNAGSLDSYLLEDFGNGTYKASFTVGPPRISDREIMVECYDQREIYVKATTICEDI